MASHFLLRRERGVGVLQVRVRSLVERLPHKMLIILVFLDLLSALVLLILVSHRHDPAEFSLLPTELVPLGRQAFPLPGRKLLVDDLLQLPNLPGRVIRQSGIVQLLGEILRVVSRPLLSAFLSHILLLYYNGRIHILHRLTRLFTGVYFTIFLT